MYEQEKELKDELGMQLSRDLKAFDIKIPEGFKDHVLGQIDLLENKKVLRKIVFQERLALAACVILPIFVMGIVVSLWDSIYAVLSVWASNIYDTGADSISLLYSEWQLLVLVLVVTAFAILFSFRSRLVESG